MIYLLFWGSLILLLYIYVGYPATLLLLARLCKKPLHPAPQEPFVTILIAAHNEERALRATIANKLAQDYPREKMEIIVISDGSTDQTDTIVKEFQAENVRLIRQEPRQGKTAALNLAIPQTHGEIIIFSDANSLYRPDALKNLVPCFSDPAVGYATGKMVYVDKEESLVGDGCSAYMKYENWLRAQETAIGSIVGVDGGIDAVRKGLYQAMNPDQLPDFVLPLNVMRQGYRVIYVPEAVLMEETLTSAGSEYRMRVRVALRAFWALRDMKSLLNPWRHGIFAWQLLSHKVLRYTAFLPLTLAYGANVLLLDRGLVYLLIFLLQNTFYGCAFLGATIKSGKRNKIIYLCWYFSLMNYAAAIAFIKFLRGKKQSTWTPRLG